MNFFRRDIGAHTYDKTDNFVAESGRTPIPCILVDTKTGAAAQPQVRPRLCVAVTRRQVRWIGATVR